MKNIVRKLSRVLTAIFCVVMLFSLATSNSWKSDAAPLGAVYLLVNSSIVDQYDQLEITLALTPSQNFNSGGILSLSFPDGHDQYWCREAGVIQVQGVEGSIADQDGTEWEIDAAIPGTITASCTQGSGASSYDTITVSGLDQLDGGSAYGLLLQSGIGKLGTYSVPGNYRIDLQLISGIVQDEKEIFLPLLPSGSVSITALVVRTDGGGDGGDGGSTDGGGSSGGDTDGGSSTGGGTSGGSGGDDGVPPDGGQEPGGDDGGGGPTDPGGPGGDGGTGTPTPLPEDSSPLISAAAARNLLVGATLLNLLLLLYVSSTLWELFRAIYLFAISIFSIAGRATDGREIYGYLLNSHERPLRGVRWQLKDSDGEVVGEGSSDERGRALFREVVDGVYLFWVESDSGQKWSYVKVESGKPEPVTVRFTNEVRVGSTTPFKKMLIVANVLVALFAFTYSVYLYYYTGDAIYIGLALLNGTVLLLSGVDFLKMVLAIR